MTREEAIAVLQAIKPIPHRGDGKSTSHALEIIAIDMAIKALEQEPCEDAIGREDALQALCRAVHKNDDTIPCPNQRVSCLWNKTKVQDYAEEILKLPPVTPQTKTGHWTIDTKGIIITLYRCSECNRTVRDDTGYSPYKDYPFCHCGAKMVESEEQA